MTWNKGRREKTGTPSIYVLFPFDVRTLCKAYRIFRRSVLLVHYQSTRSSLQLQTTYSIINAVKHQIFHVHSSIVLQFLEASSPRSLTWTPLGTSVPQTLYAHCPPLFQTMATKLLCVALGLLTRPHGAANDLIGWRGWRHFYGSEARSAVSDCLAFKNVSILHVVF